MQYTQAVREKATVEHWFRHLKDCQAVSFNPGMAKPASGDEGAWHYHVVSPQMTKDVDRLFAGAHAETGKFLFYQLAMKLLVGAYTGAKDIVLGCAGPSVDLIFLRSVIDRDATVKAALLEEQKTYLSGIGHLPIALSALRKKLEVNGVGEERGLLQLGFRYGSDDQHAESNSFRWRFDVSPLTEGVCRVSVFAPKGILDTDGADLFLANYQALVGSMAANMEGRIGEINYLSELERSKLDAFCQAEAVFPITETVIDAFLRQADRTPEKPAVISEGRTLNFRELRTEAMEIAAWLRKVHHIEPGDRVAMLLGRSGYLATATLGILWAGAVHVAIDPAYPEERLKIILESSDVKVVLTERDLLQRMADALPTGIVIQDIREISAAEEDFPVVRREPADIAFLIFTSGSTGRPKGIQQTHRCLYNTVMRQVDHGGFEKGLKVLQFSSVGFDVFIAHELFFSLLAGGELYMISEEYRKDLALLGRFIADHGIEWLLLPVSAWNTIVDVSTEIWTQRVALKHVVAAGEQLRVNGRFAKWLGQMNEVRLHNFYGPSETHNASNYRVDTDEGLMGDQPIGRPAANTRIYILAPDFRPVPVGVTGELYISGAGVAAGYLQEPNADGGKFLDDPWQSGERMYRTGDLGRWLTSGDIFFSGRKDNQVKIRGNRVETVEVEARLAQFRGVGQCCVVAVDKAGETVLAAYLTAEDRPDVGELRNWLLQELPEYMVPFVFIRMERLPLSPHGKIDRSRLPQPGQEGELLGTDYHAAATATEKDVVVLWEEILGVSPVGIKDNFFDKGGHSLKATRLAGELYRRMGVKVSLGELLRHPVLQDQAAWIDGLNREVFEAIPQAAHAADYPLSSAQRRIWFLSRLEAGSAAYNMPGFYLLEGLSEQIPVGRMVEQLLERHEILRTVFREDGQGEPVQVVLPVAGHGSAVEWCDWREKSDNEIDALMDDFAGCAFDLVKGPLIRFRIAQLNDRQSLLCFSMHHIIGDEWSMDVLVRDLLTVSGGKDEPLRIQYKDYAMWEKHQLGKTSMENHRAYWLQQLKGDLPVLHLPEDKQRPMFRSFEGDQVSFLIPGEVRDNLAAFCRGQDATLFMGVLAVLNMLLYRLSGHEDIIIGTPVTGRDHPGLADQIGIFLHSLALRTRFTGSGGFVDLLSKVKQVTLDGFHHQAFPFDRLVEELAVTSNRERNPVFDVSFVGMDVGSGWATGVVRGMTIRPYGERTGKFSKFDWTVGFSVAGEGLQMTFEFNTAIYIRETMLRWADHFIQLLRAGLADPKAAIGGLAMMKKEEKARLLEMSRGNDRQVADGETVLDLFEHWVRSTPDAVAQVMEGKTLSFGELNGLSERLALWLYSSYGVLPHDRVGILLPRNEWLVAVLLATLKLGAAYVPIDPTYPKERIEHLIGQSGCRVNVDMGSIGRFAADEKGLWQNTGWPDARRKPAVADLAYVIYTSGSTGEPKGCAITHGNLLHYIDWANRNYFSEDTKGDFGLCTSLSFDLTVTSIFCPLTLGRRITVFGSEVSVGEMMMLQFQPGSGIDSVKLTPSHVSLLRHLDLTATDVRCAILGGEQVTPAQVAILKNLNPAMRVYNEYGPTETTVGCVVKELEPGQPIVIGRPIDRTSAYVLNEFGRLCPPGVAGELYIAGDGVGQGYLNAPDLTRTKFVADPFVAGQRMYCAGDICRWQANGDLVYIGRTDGQLKIRGHRIGQGEIEAALCRHVSVDVAAVVIVTGEDGDAGLWAYITGRTSLSGRELREHLGRNLPRYMIPVSFILLEEMPLTPNGKIDRNRLAAMPGLELNAGVEYIEPGNEIEKQVLGMWQEVFGEKRIGIKDNFFDLGGHSVKAAQLIARINAVFGIRIRIESIFKEPTVEHIAELIAFVLEQKYQKKNKEGLIRIDL